MLQVCNKYKEISFKRVAIANFSKNFAYLLTSCCILWAPGPIEFFFEKTKKYAKFRETYFQENYTEFVKISRERKYCRGKIICIRKEFKRPS
jgi:hypothetical protein